MKKYLFLLSILFLFSCSSNNHNGLETLFQTKVEVKTIPTFDEINQMINNPLLFAIGDNNIVIYEKDEDSLIIIQNKNTKKISKIIQKGQGPLDMINIQDIDYDNNCFYFLSFQQQKILKYNEKLNLLKEDTLISNCLSKYICSTSLAIDSNYVFYPILKNNNRFILNDNTKELTFGQIEPQNGFTSEQLGWILQGRFTLNKKDKKLFWCSGMGDAYGIFDYLNINDIKLIYQNILKLPITTGEGSTEFSFDSNIGSASITSNAKYIYILYSGNTIGSIINMAIKEEAIYDSNIILVFDWNGNPIKQLNLNHELRCIHYDNKDQKLYGIELNDDSEYSFCEIPLE